MYKFAVKSIRIHTLYPGWEFRMKCYEQNYYTTLNENIFYELILRV